MILCKMMDAYPFLQRNFHVFVFCFFFKNLGSLKKDSTQNHRKMPFLLPLFFGGVFKFSPGFFSAAFFRILKAGRAAGQSLVLWQEAARRTLDVSLEDTLTERSDNGRHRENPPLNHHGFEETMNCLNVVWMKFMSSDVNQNVLTHQFIWIAITYQSTWIISYESISNHITQSISIPIRVTIPSAKNGPFFCSIARNFCISKIMWLSQKRLSEGGGSIWSTSKHGRETYRDPIFTERWKTQTHRNLGEQVCSGLGKKWDWLSRKDLKVFVLNIRLCLNFATKNIILHQYLETFIALSMSLKKIFFCLFDILGLFSESFFVGNLRSQEASIYRRWCKIVLQCNKCRIRHRPKHCSKMLFFLWYWRKSVVPDRLILFQGLIFFGSHMVQTEA